MINWASRLQQHHQRQDLWACCPDTLCIPFPGYIWGKKPQLLRSGDKIQNPEAAQEEKAAAESTKALGHREGSAPTGDDGLGCSPCSQVCTSWVFSCSEHREVILLVVHQIPRIKSLFCSDYNRILTLFSARCPKHLVLYKASTFFWWIWDALALCPTNLQDPVSFSGHKHWASSRSQPRAHPTTRECCHECSWSWCWGNTQPERITCDNL